MTAEPDTLSKAEFAARINVSPSRLSHWIADGLLGPEALEGEGRRARIRVEVALAQLRARRDVGQSLGNGASVRVPRPATSPAASAALPEPVAGPILPLAAPAASLPRADWLDPVEERIKQEKLDEIARRNRIAAAKEAADAGLYIETAAARREMGLIAGGMLQVLEQALDTFATAIAAKFQVPQRDAVHLLRGEFRTVRERAADKLAARAATLPHLAEGTAETDPDPPGPEAPAPEPAA